MVARAALQYVFAALLALLSTQAVAPSLRAAPAIEIVCSTEAEQLALSEVQSLPSEAPARGAAPLYISRVRPQPAAYVLFQRPPPSPSRLY